MKRYIFGMDTAHPEDCAALLRHRNVDSVVLGGVNERIAEALAAEGLELYLCFGAHSVKPDCGEASLSLDFAGTPRRWFSSGCPNDKSVWRTHLDAVLEKARRYETVRGIFVDGARFASFASAEGTDSFFTCLCPRCTEKMQAAGYDSEALREAVRMLSETRRWNSAPSALSQWLRFREACVRETMNDFVRQVHHVRAGLLAGGFVFAPTLGGFVGQTAESCRALDIVAPMLYRAYPHREGPACLNHEWAAFLSEFRDAPAGSERPSGDPLTILKQGFLPDRIRTETALAAVNLRPGQQLAPILQIEDAALPEAVSAAESGGANAVGYFMWGQAVLPE